MRLSTFFRSNELPTWEARSRSSFSIQNCSFRFCSSCLKTKHENFCASCLSPAVHFFKKLHFDLFECRLLCQVPPLYTQTQAQSSSSFLKMHAFLYLFFSQCYFILFLPISGNAIVLKFTNFEEIMFTRKDITEKKIRLLD